jgi:hypothetical protein
MKYTGWYQNDFDVQGYGGLVLVVAEDSAARAADGPRDAARREADLSCVWTYRDRSLEKD